ncbi:MAG: alpha-amylase [Deltaproteobacteria bacterium]|nr:alpha-amylase [Deltaproteobacteria bacterium]
MKTLSKNPLIYEINTWVWLGELSRTVKRPVNLATVPDEEWDSIASLGFDAVWFMGVWERSPAGIEISMRNEGLLQDFRRALPDFSAADNVGSPYCVCRYVVDEHLGGPAGLAAARGKLAERGLRLILDFVPNHVAPDHPWVSAHPEYFIQGNEEDLRRDPASFIAAGGKVLACGRDPYFPAWPDVLQINAFNPGLRSAAVETVREIADQCDGVRCDMAMLMMSDVFERTWGPRAGARPPEDYWPALIPAVRSRHPEFRFMAEAYWDLEWALQQQGFDYCYDKQLYDRLEHAPAETVRLHLCADLDYQDKLVRFIENHDEPRAAAAFGPSKHRAAAVTALTLSGARLIHEGQMEGRRVHLPVFLARRPEESPDSELLAFYRTLLEALSRWDFLKGTWLLCERTGWPDNGSYLNVISWCRRGENSRCLVVVNFSDTASQCLVRIPWDDLRGRTWQLKDAFTSEVYERDGDALCGPGLYVDLPAWGFHLLEWL